ncbi:hypothetical protein UXN85_20775 [Enterobacter hormaechei]
MAGEVKTLEIKIAIPDNREVDELYALMHAADGADYRFSRGSDQYVKGLLDPIKDDLTKEEYAFFLKAWSVLVDGGGYGRLLCAYTTWHHECQHPGKDYLAWNHRMRTALQEQGLADVYREAYEESQARLDFLVSMFQIIPTEKGINRENPLEDFGVDVEVHPAPHKK